MKEGINKIRAANFRKANDLKKLGFASAVHALPPQVKSELDRLLLTGTSIREVLRIVSNQFPQTKLPSINAVNNYKNKYLGIEMSRDAHENAVILNRTETELLTDALRKGIANFYVHLAKEILPKLAEGLNDGLEKEKMVKMPMKINSDRAIAIASLVREMNSFVRGSGINVLAFESKTTTITTHAEVEPTTSKEDVYDKLARILISEGYQKVQTEKRLVLKQQ
jgi:hypothetical protein